MATIHTFVPDRAPPDRMLNANAILAQHMGVYGGFVHLASWVAVHLLIDAGGIIALIEGQLAIGFFLLACGTALLIWTIATTRRAATDAREKAGNPPSG